MDAAKRPKEAGDNDNDYVDNADADADAGGNLKGNGKRRREFIILPLTLVFNLFMLILRRTINKAE